MSNLQDRSHESRKSKNYQLKLNSHKQSNLSVSLWEDTMNLNDDHHIIEETKFFKAKCRHLENHLEETQKEFKSLNQLYIVSQSNQRRFMKQNQDLRKRIRQLMAQISQKGIFIEQLMCQKNIVIKRQTEMRQLEQYYTKRQAELQASIDSLKRQIDIFRTRNIELQSNLSFNYHHQVEQKRYQNQKWIEMQNHWKGIYVKLEAEINIKNKELIENYQKISILQNKIVQNQRQKQQSQKIFNYELEVKSQKILSAKKCSQNLEQQKRYLQNNMQQLNLKLYAIQRQNFKLYDQRQEYGRRLVKIQKQYDSLMNILDVKNLAIKESDVKIDQLNCLIQTLKDQIRCLQNILEQKISKNKQCNQITFRNQSLNYEIEKIKRQYISLEVNFQHLQRQNKQLRFQIQKKVDQNKKQFEDKINQIKSLQKKIQNKQIEANKYVKQCDIYRNKIEDIELSLTLIRQQKRIIQMANVQKHELINSLQMKLQNNNQALNKLQDLQIKLCQVSCQKNKLEQMYQNDVKILKHKNQQLIAQKQNLVEMVNEKQQKLNSKSAILEKLQNEILKNKSNIMINQQKNSAILENLKNRLLQSELGVQKLNQNILDLQKQHKLLKQDYTLCQQQILRKNDELKRQVNEKLILKQQLQQKLFKIQFLQQKIQNQLRQRKIKQNRSENQIKFEEQKIAYKTQIPIKNQQQNGKCSTHLLGRDNLIQQLKVQINNKTKIIIQLTKQYEQLKNKNKQKCEPCQKELNKPLDSLDFGQFNCQELQSQYNRELQALRRLIYYKRYKEDQTNTTEAKINQIKNQYQLKVKILIQQYQSMQQQLQRFKENLLTKEKEKQLFDLQIEKLKNEYSITYEKKLNQISSERQILIEKVSEWEKRYQEACRKYDVELHQKQELISLLDFKLNNNDVLRHKINCCQHICRYH